MQYRPEIDGLRSVAILPVLLFHAGLPVFERGYLGVDIFFVISGYLIAGLILEDVRVNKFCIVDDFTIITGSYNWTFKARLNDENIIVIKNQPTVIAQFNDKFECIKPQYGFAVKGNEVQLLPIEKIMAKWDKPKATKPQPRINNVKSIFDKF